MIDFKRGARIQLKIPRLCYLYGETTTILVLPSDVLIYKHGNDKHCFFSVENTDYIIRISRQSFENLQYTTL